MDVLKFIVIAFLCYFISAFIHEMGHVFWGLMKGWKLFLLVVGPIKIYRETMDSKIKIGIEKNVAFWGGVGGTLPTKPSEENLKVWAKVLLAGPLTSIIFGLLMIPVFIFTESIVALLLCLMPLAMGAMCIIPMKMKTGLLYNDGTRYKRLRSGGQEEAEEKSIFQLIEVSIFEGEEASYPQTLIEPLLKSADCEFNYYGYYYTYRNAMREGQNEEAQKQLENMRNIQNKVSKTIVQDCKM